MSPGQISSQHRRNPGEFIQFILLVFALIGVLSLSAAAQPKIGIREGTTIDFGSIMRGDTAMMPVHILNQGTSPLQILSYNSSCECTLLDLASQRILPGDSTLLVVRILTDAFSEPTVRTVVLVTNDPAASSVQLFCRVNIHSLLTVYPNVIRIGREEMEKQLPVRFALTNRDSLPVPILSVSDPAFIIDATMEKHAVPPHSSIGVDLLAKPVGKTIRNGQIVVHTGREEQPFLRIPYVLDGTGSR